MKKCSVWVVAALSAMMALFTSCLGETTNEQSGWTAGIMTRNMNVGGRMMLNVGSAMLYVEALDNEETYPVNTCVGINYMINYSSEENAAAMQQNYLVASAIETEVIDQWRATYATDTVNLMENEVLLTSAYASSNYHIYVDGWFIFASGLRASSSQLRTAEWYLSYPATWTTTTYQGKNCYDFYLRATMEGTDATGATVNSVPNAYNVKTAVEQINSIERAAGNQDYYVRFKYATDTLNNQITEWRTTDPIYQLSIPQQ